MLTSFFQANAVRGIIAAVCCAAIFIIFGLLNKYRWRPPQDEIAVSYKKTDSHIKLAEKKKEGADNPVFVDWKFIMYYYEFFQGLYFKNMIM